MLAQLADLRLCALMSLRPYVPAPLCPCALMSAPLCPAPFCLSPYVVYRLGVSIDIIHLFLLSTEFATCSKPLSRDNHRKASKNVAT